MMKAEDWNVPKTQMIFQNLIPHQQKSNISVLVSTGYGVTPQKKQPIPHLLESKMDLDSDRNSVNFFESQRIHSVFHF